MPRPARVTLTPTATDADGIALSQTPAAGGAQNLTLAGALTSGGTATFSTPQHVTITAVADESGRTFTVTGTDRQGAAMTETITGPNATVAVGTKNFATVTQIAVDDDTTGAVTAGVDGTCESTWISIDRMTTAFNVGLGVNITGTATFTVQHTYDDLYASDFDESTATAYNHASIAGSTADDDGSLANVVTAVRLDVTAYTSGDLVFTVLQAGND